MKQLVTDYHALAINKLARLPLIPFSKWEWICLTQDSTPGITVPITVLQNALNLLFPLGAGRASQRVELTHSRGHQGGKLLWFVCPTCTRRVGILYHQTGLPFRCRRCCDLAYPSQYHAKRHGHGRSHRLVTQRERARLEHYGAD